MSFSHWKPEEDNLLLSLVHNDYPGGCSTTKKPWAEIADIMNQSGIGERPYTVASVHGRYHTKLKPQLEENIQAVAEMAAEAAADEASYRASLTLKPIREGVQDGMPPKMEVYETYTEATGPPKRSSDYFAK